MALRCPRCHTVVARPAAGAPVCPRCGFGGGPAVPAPPGGPAVAAGTAWRPAPAPHRPASAVWALVLGLLALVPLLGLLTAIPAIVLGILALRRAGAGRGLAITGIVLGGVGLLVGAVIVFPAAVFVLVSNIGEDGSSGAPDIRFVARDEGSTITVLRAPSSPAVDGDDLEVQGCGRADGQGGTTAQRFPPGPVGTGDALRCSGGDQVTIRHTPSGTMLFQHTFP